MEKRYIMPCCYCLATSLTAKCKNPEGHVFPLATWRGHFANRGEDNGKA